LEDFIYYEGPAPSDFTFDYEISLYNLPEHRLIQSPDGWTSFYILQKKKKRIVAGIHFHVLDSVASSPCRSPFGSIESTTNLSPDVLYHFFEFIESTFRSNGIEKIVIKNPPQIYNPALHVLVQNFLSTLQYHVVNAEVSAVFTVDVPFHELLKGWEKKKRRQAVEQTLRMKHDTPDQLEEIYHFILARRRQKGYLSSMSLADLQKTVRSFPNRFLLTSVYQQNKMVAASISIKNSPDILYHFYSDHIETDDPVNPTVFLIGELYQYSLDNKIALLDLGTSSLDGQPNFGLLNFKLRLGAKPSPKLTFAKTLT
jgi:hypothetical protein